MFPETYTSGSAAKWAFCMAIRSNITSRWRGVSAIGSPSDEGYSISGGAEATVAMDLAPRAEKTPSRGKGRALSPDVILSPARRRARLGNG